MDKQTPKVIAISSLTALFTSLAVAAGLYALNQKHQDSIYDQGFAAGVEQVEAALEACESAKQEAGAALGYYILGENDVTEDDLDASEIRAEELCAELS